MLHTSLAAALAVSAIGGARQDSLLDLMPADAAAVMEIGDLHTMLAQPAEDHGDWLKFLTDERTQALFDLTLEEEGVEVASMGLIGEMAGEIRGGAMALIDMEEGPFVGALQVTDEFEEVLLALFNNLELSLDETEILGKRALVDTSETLAFVQSDGLTFIIATEPGELEVGLESMLGRMTDGADAAGWWESMSGGLDRSIAQIFIDFAQLPIDDDPEFEMVAEVIKSLHLDFNAGEGPTGGMSASVEFHQNEIVDAFAGAFSEDVDPSLLLMAPSGAETLQVGKVDIAAMIDAVIMFVDAMEPDVEAQGEYDGALEAGSTFLGIDIQSELIDNFTGDVVGFQWVSDPATMVSEELEDVLEAMPVLGLGISDPEPFIELLEFAEPFAGDVNGEVSDEGDITTFSAEVMPGIEFIAKVSPNFVYFGADASRLADTIAREGAVKADGAVNEATFELAKETMTGPGVSIWDITMASDAMVELMASDDSFDVPDELFGLMEAFSEHVTGTGMNDFQFASNTVTLRVMTR